MIPLHNLTIKKFHEGLTNKKFSALEITQAFFAQIKGRDPEIGAYLWLNEETALRDAETVDVLIAKNESVGMLAGVPLAIKDNILIKNKPATAGSRILERYTASYDAGVIRKLNAELAVFLGKTNMDEFAMGSSTENSAFQITKNPHDPERVPGGSSGGSAAAVAAHLALAALGSDTGGSIREPASFCGVVGLKPTYGAVSRSGLIAMASSLDQIGTLTKTAEDAAILFSAIQGYDELDATSARPPTEGEYDEKLTNPDFEKIKNLTIGIPEEYFTAPDFARANSSGQVEGLDEKVKTSVEMARKTIESMGVKFKEISLPHTKYSLSCYYIIIFAEISANLARFDGIRYASRVRGPAESEARSPRARLAAELRGEATGQGRQGSSLRDIYFKTRGAGFGPEPKRRIILGTFVLSSGYYDSYYKKAQQARALIKNDFDEAFKKVDAILTPVTPTPAFKIGEKIDDPLSMYLSDIFTVPVNLAGLPALALPVRGRKSASLPIGFQLIGKPWHEADILGLGQYYEKTIIPELY